MASMSDELLSIKLTGFFLKCVGFWVPHDSKEKLLLDLALTYTIIAVLFGTAVVWTDFYYSIGDFYNFSYALTNVMTLFMVLFKLSIFSIGRKRFVDLIRYSKDNFWDIEYDAFGKKVLKECEQKCVLFVFAFTMFAQGTVCSYTITPIIDNIDKNETDRNLPFNIWLDLPVTTTPYFEILFCIETLSLYHVGVLYFCFDNLLCIFNIHVNGQFRVLYHRLETLCYMRTKEESCELEDFEMDEKYIRDAGSTLENLNDCIQQHQSLIKFVGEMEEVFRLAILGQVLVFSLLICLVSYQAFLADGTFLRRIIFLVHCAGTFVQLFMFTLTCHDLWESSCQLADAAVKSGWHLISANKGREKNLRQNLIMVIMRAQRPCHLTAFGFFPVSLETFKMIISTAMSYLTLLRQM